MIDPSVWKKAWALLDARERRNAWIVLAVASVAAVGAAFMVSSILPFLTVLADPSSIQGVPQLAWVYETLGFQSDYAFLVALASGTLLAILLSNGLQLARVYVITRYSQMRIQALSRKLLGLYLSQPYEFFLDRHSGDMSTQVLSEVDQTVMNFFRPVADLVASVLTIAALVALLIWVNPTVAIGAFIVFGGTYGVVFLLVRRWLTSLGHQRVRSNKERFVAAKEVLSGIKEVKLHGHEDDYLNRYGRAALHTVRTLVASNLIGEIPRYVMQSIAFAGLIALCMVLLDPATFGTERSSLGEMLPVIGLIALAAQRMMPELSAMYQSLTRLKFGAASVEALFADFQGLRAGPAQRRTERALGLKSELQLENVVYRYPNSSRSNLHAQALTIRAGERIGIVGGTGAGKTTLADIVLGLLTPSQGDIMVDGVPIMDANRRSWQQSVGYVPQDIFLLDASISENIAFGVSRDSIDHARVEAVAKAAQLDKFVRRELPKGYDTNVGERGVRLSGGQRQRIGIARSLYRDADLIVFDEATSALDNLTEREVMAAIEAIPGNKTIVMIAHRLSTVKSCDRIIVLDQGEIVGSGTWAELIEGNPAFQELAAAA